MTSPVLQRRMTSRLDELEPLARDLAAWCAQQGLPDIEAARLGLMVDELFTNTVLHGYGGRADGWMALLVQREDDMVHLELSDGAPHFDPTLTPPRGQPADDDKLASRPLGGLGVDFVRRLVTRWHHQALPGGNRLQLWRRVGAAPPAG